MTRLMPFVDVLIGNEEDATTVFGISAEGIDVVGGELDVESYRKVAEQLMDRFGLEAVATTLRTSISASVNSLGRTRSTTAPASTSAAPTRSTPSSIASAAAMPSPEGSSTACWRASDPQICVEFAVAASCLKHSIPGDLAYLSRAEIEALVGGDASGRVQR